MSWTQLQTIRDENRRRAELEAKTPPAECPEDGSPIVRGRGGELRCASGHVVGAS